MGGCSFRSQLVAINGHDFFGSVVAIAVARQSLPVEYCSLAGYEAVVASTMKYVVRSISHLNRGQPIGRLCGIVGTHETGSLSAGGHEPT